MFFMHALLRLLSPYFNYSDPGERDRRKRQDTEMISWRCSTNPESFRRFRGGRCKLGTFPMDIPYPMDTLVYSLFEYTKINQS